MREELVFVATCDISSGHVRGKGFPTHGFKLLAMNNSPRDSKARGVII